MAKKKVRNIKEIKSKVKITQLKQKKGDKEDFQARNVFRIGLLEKEHRPFRLEEIPRTIPEQVQPGSFREEVAREVRPEPVNNDDVYTSRKIDGDTSEERKYSASEGVPSTPTTQTSRSLGGQVDVGQARGSDSMYTFTIDDKPYSSSAVTDFREKAKRKFPWEV